MVIILQNIKYYELGLAVELKQFHGNKVVTVIFKTIATKVSYK